jgi:predicted RNA-binding protein with EMAP domain
VIPRRTRKIVPSVQQRVKALKVDSIGFQVVVEVLGTLAIQEQTQTYTYIDAEECKDAEEDTVFLRLRDVFESLSNTFQSEALMVKDLL